MKKIKHCAKKDGTGATNTFSKEKSSGQSIAIADEE